MKKFFTLAILCLSVILANAQIMKNDFLSGYNVGDDLEKGKYNGTSQGDADPIQVNTWMLSGKVDDNNQKGVNPKVVAPLVYTGYIDSGKDVAIDLLKLEEGGRTSIYSLSNNNNDYGVGTYYLTFLSNVSSAGTANEFLSLDGNYTGNAQRVRYTVKGIDETETYQIGISGGTSPASSLAGSFNYNQTYLNVIKITIDGTGLGTCTLYVNPAITETEPTDALATANIEGTALKSIRGLVIRQRTTLAAKVSGIRLTSTWKDAVGYTPGSGLNNSHVNNTDIRVSEKSIITDKEGAIKVYDLTGVEVLSELTTGRLDTNLNNGVYIVRFVDAAGTPSTAKILIK